MKNRYSIILLAFLCFPIFAKAQEEQKQPDFLIFGVPQYLLVNGLRIDLDIHNKGTQNWLVLSPYYYYDNSSVDPMNLSGSEQHYDLYSYDKMIGVGMGLSKKIFLSKKNCSNGLYLSFGGSYRFFNIDGNSFTWIEYTGDDGLTYQEMQDIEYKLYIHALHANSTMGYQFLVMENLYIDVFMGFGIKYSFHNSPDKVTVKYNRGYYDYGYTGTQFIGGIRFGIDL